MMCPLFATGLSRNRISNYPLLFCGPGNMKRHGCGSLPLTFFLGNYHHGELHQMTTVGKFSALRVALALAQGSFLPRWLKRGGFVGVGLGQTSVDSRMRP